MTPNGFRSLVISAAICLVIWGWLHGQFTHGGHHENQSRKVKAGATESATGSINGRWSQMDGGQRRDETRGWYAVVSRTDSGVSMENFMGSPGPWEMDEFENIVHGKIDGWGRKNTVRVSGVSLPGRVTNEYRANSKLVMAAPELLEALQAIISGLHSGSAVDIGAAEVMARTAINKALGKE